MLFCKARFSVTPPFSVRDDLLDKCWLIWHSVVHCRTFMSAFVKGFGNEWMCISQTVIKMRWNMWTECNEDDRVYHFDLKTFWVSRFTIFVHMIWKWRWSRCWCWKRNDCRSKRLIAFSVNQSSRQLFFQVFLFCFPKITRKLQKFVRILVLRYVYIETIVTFQTTTYFGHLGSRWKLIV